MRTPVVGGFERLDVLHRRGIIMEAVAEELPGHTECFCGMDVDGDAQLPDDPHTPGQDLGTDVVDIGYLVLNADVVGPEAGVQQVLRRRKQLEHHAPDRDEARVPVVAGQIAVELRPIKAPRWSTPLSRSSTMALMWFMCRHSKFPAWVSAPRFRPLDPSRPPAPRPLVLRAPEPTLPRRRTRSIVNDVERSSGVRSGGHPVRHRRRVIRVGHGADRIQPGPGLRTVTRSCWRRCSDQDATTNCSMIRGGSAASCTPASCSLPCGADEPGVLECGEQIVGEPLARPVLDRHQDRPTRRLASGQGWGQSPAGMSSSGGIGLEAVASPASGPRASATPRPAWSGAAHVLGRDAHHRAAHGVPPLEHDQIERHATSLHPTRKCQLVEGVESRKGQNPRQPGEDQCDGRDGGDMHVAEHESDHGEAERAGGQQPARCSAGAEARQRTAPATAPMPTQPNSRP